MSQEFDGWTVDVQTVDIQTEEVIKLSTWWLTGLCISLFFFVWFLRESPSNTWFFLLDEKELDNWIKDSIRINTQLRKS